MTFPGSIKQRFDLEGRIAVVTGASKGIGAAIALGLAEFGAKVVISSRKQDALEQVKQLIEAAGGEAWARACHVGDPEQCENLVEAVMDRFGRIDILVNNAAINPYYGPLDQIPDAAYQKTLQVNLEGPRVLSNLVAQPM
ncbi:MAG: SDR family NAD(P)-dependent oxidoreductase, partial [Saprospiraceae bacterium]|nr:SDR family NAD(P)-dependent oxidoreductase [Saprospiraceae bacterium]